MGWYDDLMRNIGLGHVAPAIGTLDFPVSEIQSYASLLPKVSTYDWDELLPFYNRAAHDNGFDYEGLLPSYGELQLRREAGKKAASPQQSAITPTTGRQPKQTRPIQAPQQSERPQQETDQAVQPLPPTPGPGGTLSVVSAPSISVAGIQQVLQQYNSPATPYAQDLYNLGVKYGINPAIALAFFIMESSAGTAGLARTTKSLGNIRHTPGYANYQGFRNYASWRDGMEDWYKLISDLYVRQWGKSTVETIVPTYAPAADNNHPAAYISTVRRLVNQWAGR